jgi:hypothetical protein
MNKIMTGLMATALTATFAIASAMPASATPIVVPTTNEARTDVQKVDYVEFRPRHRHWRAENGGDYRAFRSERRADRWESRREWREDRYDRSAYRQHHRRHWGHHNGWRDQDNNGVRLELSF